MTKIENVAPAQALIKRICPGKLHNEFV